MVPWFLKQRNNETADIEDFAEVSEVSQEDTIEVIRTLNELILMMKMSSPDEDAIFDADEIERQVVYKKKWAESEQFCFPQYAAFCIFVIEKRR